MQEKVSNLNRASRNALRFIPDSPGAVMLRIFLLALAVRLIYIAFFYRSPFFSSLIVDAQWHDEWAARWAGSGWDMDGRAFFRAPFYPFFLSVIYTVFSHIPAAARMVQAVLGAGTAAAITGSGFCLGGKKTAFWAGITASAYGPMIFFDGEILIPSLLLALLSWALFFLLSHKTPGSFLAGSVLLGLAGITRPTALALLPAVLVYAWMRSRDRSDLRKKLIIGAVAFSLLPAAVVTILNARAEKSFVFIASQGGINFYAGNNSSASGRSVDIPEMETLQGGWSDFVERSRLLAAKEMKRNVNSNRVSAFWMRKGLAWMRSSPAAAAKLTLKKIYYLFNSFETPNNRSLYLNRPFPLNLLLWKFSWFGFPWGLLLPLAAAGAVLGFKGKENRHACALLAGWALLYGLALVPFFICSRFRMGMLPALIPLAALSLSSGKRLWSFAPLAAALPVLLLSNSGFLQSRFENPAQEYAKLGAAQLAAGDARASAQSLQKAVELDRSSAEYPYLLGHSYMKTGDRTKALFYFKQSLAKGANNFMMLRNLGGALMQLGDTGDAAVALEKAAELRPENPDIWLAVGKAFEKAGRDEKAVGSYLRSTTVSPRNAGAYINLGFIYKNRGEIEKAIGVWRKGSAFVPGSFALHFNLALAYSEIERYPQALAHAKDALAISPGHAEVLKLKMWLEKYVH